MQYHELTNSIMILRVGLGESRLEVEQVIVVMVLNRSHWGVMYVHRTQHTGLQ